jgi:hypothetical protein
MILNYPNNNFKLDKKKPKKTLKDRLVILSMILSMLLNTGLIFNMMFKKTVLVPKDCAEEVQEIKSLEELIRVQDAAILNMENALTEAEKTLEAQEATTSRMEEYIDVLEAVVADCKELAIKYKECKP